MQRIEVFVFALTMVPLGLVLACSAQNRESVPQSGGKGLVTLGLTWLAFWSLFGALAKVNPYSYLLRTLDTVLQQSLEFYRSQQAGITPDVLYNLEQATNSARLIVPVLMPGILAVLVITTVLITMVTANSFLGRLSGSAGPWGRFSEWKLPEQLIWLPIGATIVLLIGTGTLRHAGGWLLMASGLLYFFQGVAVLQTLLDRWSVPIFFRITLYFICFIQSYSVILLALLGMSDVWFNVRQTSKQSDNG